MKLILNSEFNLYEKDGNAFCDTLQATETFEKRHADVLRDIEKVVSPNSGLSTEFTERNFALSEYKDGSGKKNPKYLLTKDGFTIVTFGYTGRKAMKFKEIYINRFNQIENLIKIQLSQKEIHPALTDAIKEAHNEPKHYHFSNEQNMIYKIVSGMDAKTYRSANNIAPGTIIKPYLNSGQIKAVEMPHRVDVGLFEAGLSYDERKQILQKKFNKSKLMLTA